MTLNEMISELTALVSVATGDLPVQVALPTGDTKSPLKCVDVDSVTLKRWTEGDNWVHMGGTLIVTKRPE